MAAMKMDAEIKVLGFEILAQHLGLVEAERFITLIQRERFDYTQWRQNLFADLAEKRSAAGLWNGSSGKQVPTLPRQKTQANLQPVVSRGANGRDLAGFARSF